MDMKTIIEMAREAGLPEIIDNANIPWAELSIFAVFIRADEREACVQIVENEAAQYAEPVWAFEIVNDIRARGNT